MAVEEGDVSKVTGAMMAVIADQLKSSVGHNGASTSKVEFNLGGVGLGLALGICAVMLTANIFMGWMFLDGRDEVRAVRAELREHGHQLNAIYRVAPSVEREVRARMEEDARLRPQDTE